MAEDETALAESNPEADLYTAGFKAGIVVQDPKDGAIVARGRTTLGDEELARALRPALQYLGVKRDDYDVAVDGGAFELRVAKTAAESSSPALDSVKVALQVLVGFGLFGLAMHQLVAPFVAAIVWGAALILGGWQLRRGLASGRAMLAARLAVALGLLASEDKAILPPETGT